MYACTVISTEALEQVSLQRAHVKIFYCWDGPWVMHGSRFSDEQIGEDL
jgi:hypothetical protein